MSDYYLRNVDPDLWKKVKARVDYEGRSVRYVLLYLLKLYATHGLDYVTKTLRERR